jgi:hypothetical protein
MTNRLRERIGNDWEGARLSQGSAFHPQMTKGRFAIRPYHKTINSGALMRQLPFFQDFLPLIAPVGQFSISSV